VRLIEGKCCRSKASGSVAESIEEAVMNDMLDAAWWLYIPDRDERTLSKLTLGGSGTACGELVTGAV
jgi:hypothetical protein